MFYLTYAPGPPIREFVDYAQVGLPPKLFSRVLRFERACSGGSDQETELGTASVDLWIFRSVALDK